MFLENSAYNELHDNDTPLTTVQIKDLSNFPRFTSTFSADIGAPISKASYVEYPKALSLHRRGHLQFDADRIILPVKVGPHCALT